MRRRLLLLTLVLAFAPALPAAAGDAEDIFPVLPWSPSGTFPNQFFGLNAAPAGDVNGDGYGDIVVSIGTEDTSQVRAALYLGGPDGPSLVPAWTFTLQPEDTRWVRPAGDVNGDGYADVMLVRPFATIPNHPFGGRVMIFHGGPGGLPAQANYELFSPLPADNQFFGYSADWAGDVNGDGYADVVIGTPHYTDSGIVKRGMVCVFHGSPAGLAAAPARTLLGSLQSGRFGESASTAGDVNGDGFDDLVVGASEVLGPGDQENAGAVSIYHGSASGIPAFADTFFFGFLANASAGTSVSTAGDVNGDGYADVLFGAPGTMGSVGRAHLVFGSPNGATGLTALFSPVSLLQERYGSTVTTLGDTDGDGYAEFAVAGRNPPTMDGHAVVYSGGPTFSQIGQLLPPAGSQLFAQSIAPSGDTDGDGRSEILVADMLGGGTGRVFLRGRLRTTSVPATGWPKAAPQAGTRYGNSLAIVDGRDNLFFPMLVIGDPGFDGFGRVFEHRGGGTGGLDPQVDHTVPGTLNFQGLGTRVAAAGDFDGDGSGDYVVSSPTVNSSNAPGATSQVGRIDLVRGNPVSPVAPITLLMGVRAFDRIGSALAGGGDVNGDGYHDVLVGAREADTAALADAGRVWLVYGGPTPPPTWQLEGTAAGQGMGAGVALTDLDGDGYTDVVIGSSSPPAGAQLNGRVQVHYGGPSGPANLPGLVLEAPNPSVSFGFTVVALGDVNGDGVADLGVGAPQENNRGVARVYAGSLGRSQSEFPMITYAGAQDGGRFGEAMAGGGDVDGDGFGDLSIGQPGFDGGQLDIGRCHLYFGARFVPEATAAVVSQVTEAGGQLGASIAPLADVNGDGYADWIFAAPGAVGRVYATLGSGGQGARPGRRHQFLAFDLVGKRVLFPPSRSASADQLLVALFPHAPMGRTRSALQLEMRTQNEALTGIPTATSAFVYESGVPGDESTQLFEFDAPQPGRGIHVRARQVTRSPFFQRSTWSSLDGHRLGEHDVRFAGTAVGVEPGVTSPVTRPRLAAVSPNPARGASSSTIAFALPAPARATLDVFDVRGARVRRVAAAAFAAGPASVVWDGRDEQGRTAPAGLYFVELVVDGKRADRGRIVRLP